MRSPDRIVGEKDSKGVDLRVHPLFISKYTMKRERKKYLVFRKDREGERMSYGVFSSHRKAEAAVFADCARLAEMHRAKCPDDRPLLERVRDGFRLAIGKQVEIQYSLATKCEDAEVLQ